MVSNDENIWRYFIAIFFLLLELTIQVQTHFFLEWVIYFLFCFDSFCLLIFDDPLPFCGFLHPVDFFFGFICAEAFHSESFPIPLSWWLQPVFYEGTSGFMCRSLMYLELVLCKVIDMLLSSFSACGHPVFSASFVEDILFSPVYLLAPLSNLKWLELHVFFF